LEHHGRDFQIIRFEPQKFDHSKTGYELSGSHKALDCRKCHQPVHMVKQLSKKKQNTYLGLGTFCADCHADEHAGKLGKDCAKCHGGESFAPAMLFDHAKTNFKLSGAHAKLECRKCHKPGSENGQRVQTFAALPFNNCTPCHKDFHEGRFDPACSKCHNTESFNRVNTAEFDHSKTRFKLSGAHQNLKCVACHGKDLASKPKAEFCTDCHADYHKGQFADNNGKPRQCDQCHSLDRFKPSRFSLEQHNAASFQLAGSHLSIPCTACHYRSGEWLFKPMKKNCSSCHDNIHGSEISGQFMGNLECGNCHTISGWAQVSFDHAKSAFPLSGKHARTACGKCHRKTDEPTKKLLFISLGTACTGCHEDIHQNQFAKDAEQYCLRCHTTENWRPVKFDHTTTGFSLLGAHEKVPCDKCHKEVLTAAGKYKIFKIKEFKCADCHS
jgi:predicted CXXCH cytochrome family protein